MVLIPFSEKVSTSQKIENPEEQKRLQNPIRSSTAPSGFGVIVRTVAVGKCCRISDKDRKNLYKKWQLISQKLRGAKSKTQNCMGNWIKLLQF